MVGCLHVSIGTTTTSAYPFQCSKPPTCAHLRVLEQTGALVPWETWSKFRWINSSWKSSTVWSANKKGNLIHPSWKKSGGSAKEPCMSENIKYVITLLSLPNTELPWECQCLVGVCLWSSYPIENSSNSNMMAKFLLSICCMFFYWGVLARELMGHNPVFWTFLNIGLQLP